jgi:hypothetical protein
MTEIVIPESFDGVSDDDLATLATQVRDAGLALANDESDEALEQAEVLSAGLDRIEAETEARTTAAAAKAERLAAVRSRFSTEAEPEVEADEEEEAEEDAEAEEEDAEEESEPEVKAATKPSAVQTLARKTVRPVTPKTNAPISITAAADVPGFSTGQAMDSMAQVVEATIGRMKAFGIPQGDGLTENLQHYGVAKFRMDFPDELTIKGTSEDEAMKVIAHATDEKRLTGNSLTAAGGWCAPSETLYDLCVTETLDGMVSVPEVNVARGGFRFTKGPQFADLYSDIGFLQTEAQAIAGTTKACYEVECPTFTDIRLDAIGVCIKVPILTNVGYPELVQRVLSGSMVVHAHKVNASVIGRMATSAGAALDITDFSSSVQNTLSALELIANQLRQKYKLALDSTVEVVLPYWVKSTMRDDLGFRTYDADVADAAIASLFSERHLNVQWVYDWQEPTWPNAVLQGYPATVNALVYPAGTFVKGTSDVINLNAVYDAASLAVNTYTGLFFEQGLLVANTCMNAVQVEIPVCRSGRTGIANVSVCGTGTEA